MLVVDAGTEFGTENFHEFLQEHDIKHIMIAPEAHWQNSRVEHHGGILQIILDKMDKEQAIETAKDLEVALAFATQTKNKWSRNKGYPAEFLVFGKLTKCPGSVINDSSNASHEVALQEALEGLQFREKFTLQERTRRAFCEVDNTQSFRRAVQQHSLETYVSLEDRDSWI